LIGNWASVIRRFWCKRRMIGEVGGGGVHLGRWRVIVTCQSVVGLSPMKAIRAPGFDTRRDGISSLGKGFISLDKPRERPLIRILLSPR
jgi:hypothetical protein